MVESITIKIKEQDYIVKKSFRALMLFEEKSGRGIEQMKETVNDLLLLFWCMLKANNKETFKYSFDEFIDVCDESPESIEVFNTYLLQQAQVSTDTDSEKKIADQ